ncbi:glycosyltransferase family 4 protein [Azospirillum formosense]|uniref:glycosyltransferase family 4 protein n=1 Tax=Azospirillum formosense TaxID=861533 RepID=UPI001C925591|nr:glycosyltransferase family 4 protein [Azospirillum formosense]MBY3756052.1 glycosyltransferase family 4 protein [Azospirillum formosense]
MSNKRVLIISHGHPAFSLGGAEVASYNLHQGLHDLPGWESHYLARTSPPVTPHGSSALMALRQKEREVLYHANDYDHFRLSNRNLPGLEKDFVRYVRDLQPDVVNFHHFLGLGIETIQAIRQALPRVPIVVTFHEYLSICHHHGQMVKTSRNTLCYRASPADCACCFPHIGEAQFFKRELFLKTFLEQADFYVSPSNFLIDRYVDWGLPREKFRMIENGLTVEGIAPPRPLARGGKRNRFAFFGQLTEFKGAHVLVEAIGRVSEKAWGEDGALMIFGGNLERQPEAYQKKFNEAVERAGDRVRFYGSYRSAELPGLMKDVDWVVMPSIWWENSPVVIQEAFLHGRPIISSNIGGMGEKVTHGVDGLHFRNASVEDLVDRLTEALTTPDLWDRLRMRIRRPIDRAECARRHADVFDALIANAGGGAVTMPERAVAQKP